MWVFASEHLRPQNFIFTDLFSNLREPLNRVNIRQESLVWFLQGYGWGRKLGQTVTLGIPTGALDSLTQEWIISREKCKIVNMFNISLELCFLPLTSQSQRMHKSGPLPCLQSFMNGEFLSWLIFTPIFLLSVICVLFTKNFILALVTGKHGCLEWTWWQWISL